MVELEDVASADSLCVREEAEPSVEEYETAFPSTGHLRTVWSYKYEHRSSENIMPFLFFLVCYSDAAKTSA